MSILEFTTGHKGLQMLKHYWPGVDILLAGCVELIRLWYQLDY